MYVAEVLLVVDEQTADNGPQPERQLLPPPRPQPPSPLGTFQPGPVADSTRVAELRPTNFPRTLFPLMLGLPAVAVFGDYLFETLAISLAAGQWRLPHTTLYDDPVLMYLNVSIVVMFAFLPAIITFHVVAPRLGGLAVRFAEAVPWRDGWRSLRWICPKSALKLGCALALCGALPLRVVNWIHLSSVMGQLWLPALVASSIATEMWLIALPAILCPLAALFLNLMAGRRHYLLLRFERSNLSDAAHGVCAPEPGEARILHIGYLIPTIVMAALGLLAGLLLALWLQPPGTGYDETVVQGLFRCAKAPVVGGLVGLLATGVLNLSCRLVGGLVVAFD